MPSITRTATLTLVAASFMFLSAPLRGEEQLRFDAQQHGNGNGNGRGNDRSNDSSEGLSIPISTAPGSPITGSGVFLLKRFVNDGGTVKAVGIVTGTFTNGVQSVSIARNVALPVTIGQGGAPGGEELNNELESGPSASSGAELAQIFTCPILHLDLGPLALDLLGLQVDLSRIILDIVADPGPGNLLGNLLCAVTNLLNSPGPLATLLNRILDLLLA